MINFLKVLLITLLGFSQNGYSATYSKGGYMIEENSSIASAGTTTTLTKDSYSSYIITGTSTQTIAFGSALLIPTGRFWEFKNESTGIVTIQGSTGTVLRVLAPNEKAKIRLTANGTAAGTWSVENNVAVNVAQATFFGGISQNGASGCNYFETTSTGPTNFVTLADGTGCNAWSVKSGGTGTVAAVGTNSQGIVLSNVPAGRISIKVKGGVASNASTGVCNWRAYDGTTGYDPQYIYNSATTIIVPFLEFDIPIAASISTMTLIFQAGGSTGGTCNFDNTANGRNLTFDVYYFPSQSQAAVRMDQIRAPTITKLTSGSGTYTPPAGVTQLKVRMVGGGGGGGGAGVATPSAGGAGGTTTFGTTFLTATGGSGGAWANQGGGGGGTCTINSPAIGRCDSGNPGAGATGTGVQAYWPGGMGGVSPFGGGGNSAGGLASAAANTGSGGGGGSPGGSGGPAGGGGSGGHLEALIVSPASSYSFSIAAGGAAGTSNSSASVPGSGGSGYIEITEIYGWNLPIVIGGVSSSSAGAEMVQRARVNCGSTSSVATQSGSWLSLANISGSRCTGTLTGFSAAPTCVATYEGNETTIVRAMAVTTPSATTMTIGCVYQTGASTVACPGTDTFNVICMGPR
jgi:hypothetical protein